MFYGISGSEYVHKRVMVQAPAFGETVFAVSRSKTIGLRGDDMVIGASVTSISRAVQEDAA